MEFSDRKTKCKKIQMTDTEGSLLPESFYALITDAGVTQEGTPLNAETLNAAFGEVDTQCRGLQSKLGNLYDTFTRAASAKEYDGMELSADTYDGKDMQASDYDICGHLMCAGDNPNFSGYSIFDLHDPTTGRKDFLQNIVSNLFSLISQITGSFTAEEFDGFTPEITRSFYDQKDISAIHFDQRGKSFF